MRVDGDAMTPLARPAGVEFDNHLRRIDIAG